MTIKVLGRLTAADQAKRTITGLVLPFGSPGNTSAGTVTASKDSVKIADQVLLNMEHDGTRPVGRMLSHEVTDDGIVATFTVANTTAGNDLLAEVAEGLRTGLSVEVQNPVIRNGSLLGGLLDAVAAVTKPAFDLARVSAMTASDEGEIEDEDETTEDQVDEVEQTDETSTDEPVETDEADTDSESIEDEDDNEETDPVKTATASLAASAASGKQGIKTTREFVERLTAATKAGDRTMLAALADITQSGVGGDVTTQQFLGELWDGKSYTRRIVPLVKGGTLESYDIKGWRWVTKPEVATYAGNKAAVTSGAVDTEAMTTSAVRLAGAHDIDRKFFDFGDTAFLQSYLEAMTESYARKSDAALAEFIEASATVVAPGTVPSGVTKQAAALVDAALAVIDYGVPTFALVAPDVYRSLLLTPKDQVLEFLNMALGLEDGTMQSFKIVPTSTLPVRTVIAGVDSAVQFLELPGSPIRVDALNIANGGVDQGLFGYYATVLHSDNGLASVQHIV
jgi:hypothetical protein